MNRKSLGLVFILFILAYFLRVMFLSRLALTFGYDQARDAYVSQQIIDGDIKILGPPASTPGLYHGVFYYYLLAPAYLVGGGSPIIAAYWIALLNAATVFIVFYLTYLLLKRKGAALLAAFFFAISFEATQYATWLSNPTIGVWTVPLMYLGLWQWISGEKRWGPLLAGLGLGLSIQANVFLLYHTVPLVLWLWVSRKKLERKGLFNFLVILILSVSTMIVSEVKFGFRSLSGVTSLLTAQDPIIASKKLGDFIVLFFNQLGQVFAASSYPGNVGYGGIFVLVLISLALYRWSKKGPPANRRISWEPFLATWLFAHVTVVTLGGASTPFLLVGIGPAVSILLGIFIYNWWTKGSKILSILVLAVIVFANLAMILRENPRGATIFAIQKDMVLAKQLPAIDYTYRQVNSEAFSLNSLTSPLWINIVWTYLYKWYGEDVYGYIPQWHGRDQVGQLDSLPDVAPDTKNYFLILEPLGGIPLRYLDETIGEEDTRSVLLEEKYFGELGIQKRQKVTSSK